MDSSEKATEKTGRTLLTLVVDRSGSMSEIKAAMERGLRALIAEQAGAEEPCTVTLLQFNEECELVVVGVPAAEMPRYTLEPSGGTALLDAIGRTISMVELQIALMSPQDRPSTVIFAVISDGDENSSKEWDWPRVRQAIEEKTAEGWHFTFLGADQSALEEGLRLGIDPDSLLTWEPSDDGTAGAMKSLSDSSRRLQRGGASRIEYTEDERLAAAGRALAPLAALRSSRPYLFLEVDGVLNVLEKDIGAHAEMFDDFAAHVVPFDAVAGYRRSVEVWLSPTMGARLGTLGVDIHWVTMWEHRAGSAIAPRCGVPRDLPVLPREGPGEEWEGDWKFEAIKRAVDEHPKPFIWIDGDIDFLDDGPLTPRAWAASLSVPSLLIAPDTGSGLLPRQLDAVEEFVRQLDLNDDESLL
jgi:hypothetical protein